MVEITCPKCSAPMPYVAELAGREVFCLSCGSHFVVPTIDPAGPLADEAQPPKPIKVDVAKPPRTPGNQPERSDSGASGEQYP